MTDAGHFLLQFALFRIESAENLDAEKVGQMRYSKAYFLFY